MVDLFAKRLLKTEVNVADLATLHPVLAKGQEMCEERTEIVMVRNHPRTCLRTLRQTTYCIPVHNWDKTPQAKITFPIRHLPYFTPTLHHPRFYYSNLITSITNIEFTER